MHALEHHVDDVSIKLCHGFIDARILYQLLNILQTSPLDHISFLECENRSFWDVAAIDAL